MKSIQIERLLIILFLAIIGVALFFLIKTKSKEELRIDNIRKTMFLLSSQVSIDKNRDSLLKPENIFKEDNRFLLKISELYMQKELSIKAMNRLDSITQTREFEQLHPLNKFYTYYLITLGYNSIGKYEFAYRSNLKANSYIEGNLGLYAFEKERLKDLTHYISANIFESEEMNLTLNLNRYEKAVQEKNENLQLIFAYNISFHHFNLKNYKKSLQYALISEKLLQNNYSHSLYIYIQSKLAQNYLQTAQYKKYDSISEKLQKVYFQKKISENEYNLFRASNLSSLVEAKFLPEVQSEMDELLAIYPQQCSSRFELFMIYSAQIRYYQLTENLEKEKQALQNCYYYINSCGDLNAHYIAKNKEIIQRFLDFPKKYLNDRERLYWYKKEDAFHNMDSEKTKGFIKLIEFFGEREVAYINKDLKLQKSLLKAKNGVIMVFTILIILLILLSIYISKLYYKNKKNGIELKNNTYQLAHKNEIISRKNRQMSDLVNELRESNENLHNFAKVAAHDIKSPLSTIHSIVEFLSDKYNTTLEKSDIELLTYLKDSTHSLTDMINVLLNYSKNKNEILTNEIVNTHTLLHRVHKNLKNSIEKNKGQIHFPQNAPKVLGNSSLLEQLFQNLIANAIKFTAEDQPPIIEINFKIISVEEVEFSVKDNGIGIKKEDMKDIFKFFHRVKNDSEYEGNGIGLATCKKIVQEMGGEIWVKSNYQRGSTFYFTLPLAQQEAYI